MMSIKTKQDFYSEISKARNGLCPLRKLRRIKKEVINYGRANNWANFDINCVVDRCGEAERAVGRCNARKREWFRAWCWPIIGSILAGTGVLIITIGIRGC